MSAAISSSSIRRAGAILSVAGKIDWPTLKAHAGKLFGDWKAGQPQPISEQLPPRKYQHFPVESSQTHIGIAFDSVPYPHPDYFQIRGAVGVLSDGMSSRLFTEVREKRGLVYTVYASMPHPQGPRRPSSPMPARPPSGPRRRST